jgi:N utilization substance protein A
MNKELLDALSVLEREKNISRFVLLEAIENSLLTACKNHYGKADNIKATVDPETCDLSVVAEKTVVEDVEDTLTQISLEQAKAINPDYVVGDVVQVHIESKAFGRIATQNAKNVILQKIREEERRALYHDWYSLEKEIVSGVIQRYLGRNISVNLGKVDALLPESEQIRGEVLRPTEKIKFYVLEVKDSPKGPRISVSRTHPELVKRLFELEVAEVRDGTVEIKTIAREPGSRSKIAVQSHDPNVDPVGACVGVNGSRVNSVVNELKGEKIDVIAWDENPALLIENALSPAKVICVVADEESREAKVIVPDYQLSLAIGKEGQNARLSARLTGYKIDIKSETQARESGLFDELGLDYQEEGILEGDGYDEYPPYGGYDENGVYTGDGPYNEYGEYVAEAAYNAQGEYIGPGGTYNELGEYVGPGAYDENGEYVGEGGGYEADGTFVGYGDDGYYAEENGDAEEDGDAEGAGYAEIAGEAEEPGAAEENGDAEDTGYAEIDGEAEEPDAAESADDAEIQATPTA